MRRSQTKLASKIPFWEVLRQNRQVTDRPTLHIAQSERLLVHTTDVYVLMVVCEISNNRVETFSITTRENMFSAARVGS